MLSRRLIFPVVVLLLMAFRPALADDAQDAVSFISQQAQTTLSVASDKSLTPASRLERYKQIFDSAFDLPAISQFVLARYWRSATPDQQKSFIALFEQYNVLTWGRRFDDYSGEQIKTVGAEKLDGPDEWQVNCEVIRPQGQQPVDLQWRLHKTAQGWKITDVVIAGASLALAQRQDFSSVLQQNGNKLDALLSTLRAKVDQLKAA